MTQTESDRIHQRIDNSLFKKRTVDQLHAFVDEFLSPGSFGILSKGISQKRQVQLIIDFDYRRLLTKSCCNPTDHNGLELDRVLDDVERVYLTILDQSVIAKKGFWEKCIAALKVPLHLSPKLEGNLLSPKIDLSISKNEAELSRDLDAERMESEN
jgi:hypothetical protein